MASQVSTFSLFSFVLLMKMTSCLANRIELGSRLVAGDDKAWVSDNRTFMFGFTPTNSKDHQFQLGIWYGELPGDRVVVWSANRNSPVGKDAALELDTTGNLVLVDKNVVVWVSNTSGTGVRVAQLSDSGNLILYNGTSDPVWQSFSHPFDTLLPGQPLTVSLELTSTKSPSHGGYYTLKMLQETTSLSLGLTYNSADSYNSSSDFHSNYSYWSGPEISNVTGNITAVLDEQGNFGIVYGASSEGIVYVYKNDVGNGGSQAGNRPINRSVLRRLTLEMNGNLRLYRWDNDVNGSQQWVPEWAAVSNPCDIAGTCGNGICNLDGSKTNASCSCLPGTSQVAPGIQCVANSALTGNCDYSPSKNPKSQYKISTVPQTNYYYSELSVIANYSDISISSKCGDACLSDCECVASVYGLKEETAYCWILKNVEFGGFEDPGSTLFVKVDKDGSTPPITRNGNSSKRSSSYRNKVVVLPIVLCMSVLVGLLCFLLYYSFHRRRSIVRAIKGSLTVSGAPLNFSYRDLQSATNNFTQLLGAGGFGSVFKGSLGDGTLVAVKKLERLLVYEFMKNGSLDRWIFPSYGSKKVQDKLLNWNTRFQIAIETAQGIAYFHEQCRNRIIHCDIKPENILLDENFCPKVSDFGLAKLMAREHSHVVTMVRGTRGYLAPEWVSNRPVTVKADVYSYGMLLLEIIGGRRNFDMSLDAEDFYYPGWAFKEMANRTPNKVADKRLMGVLDEEQLVRALQVAFWCIQDEVWMRPSMGEVVKMLEGSVEINPPPIPQTVLELVEEGLDHVYRAMRRDFTRCQPASHISYSYSIATQPSSQATCSYSTMSPR
ncbi:G-type lectin S-receptor-like serine/threonine-protein kinase [Thalictrum thalictroides]|uniref:Receptor-like serine/threonine-protein kinase n=1 Tax=Thalictrum thalictroides TaxID=46969 RepID=A0A7J6XCI1_THATH|nr:G-type lectin S-receptor-like serine/threonine-protein kinase [Thalictrum thalictroides]